MARSDTVSTIETGVMRVGEGSTVCVRQCKTLEKGGWWGGGYDH